MPRFTVEDKWRAIDLLQADKSQILVLSIVRCSKSSLFVFMAEEPSNRKTSLKKVISSLSFI